MSEALPADSQGKIIVFGASQIRRAWVDEQWYFSVIDIVGALTDSASPPKYWDAMKRREKAGAGVDLSTFCRKVALTGADGKTYQSDGVNTEAAFRIIQSIPSPKAEPFKRWLAEVGYQRVQEIENPELAQQRMKELYKEKGYPDDWIEKRVRGIAVRDELTSEWQKRGIADQQDFAILTAEISLATFGVTPAQYKNLKGLQRENLRDHMNDLELIFTMLGEAATTEIARNKDAQGFVKNKRAARAGGSVAGSARRQLEAKSGRKVITSENYLIDKPKPKLPSKLKNPKKT
ncbi:Bro-N domain-containing protein [Polaromonas sp.]|uniref:BRO-N domain-containing protein n=1 Tax=Polaromonas sp. TaxID=1869339 RepID=UPI0035617522